ncbi:energy transducer TonB [Paraburkholderia tropica]|uniref:energy transducer TonB n=1 Tax=Paraburkholderia tropica TaxID=92647 RepID=UPI001F1DD8A7|nr:energy transducer TonB [Paraburkholderia tropica]MDE1144763.1 energy transducer TonB [Paraburkholderia tropica]
MSTNNSVRLVTLLDAQGPRTLVCCVLAAVLCALSIDCLMDNFKPGAQGAAPPPTLDARLVEIAPPPPAPSPSTPLTHAIRPVAPNPPAHVARHPVTPRTPPARWEPVAPRVAAAPTQPDGATTPSASPATDETTPSTHATSAIASSPSGDVAAHPLVQPLPEIPDDLRAYAYRAIALARFTIHVDGSVDVALIKPTPNPRLNQLLMESLKSWRFSPALKDGRAIESEQDIRVHFNIG